MASTNQPAQVVSATNGSSISDVIQIANNYQISVGQLAPLKPSLLWEELPSTPEIPKLLAWNRRLAPHIGRKSHLDQLLEWGSEGEHIRIKVLSGPGGAGKSRLAAEFAETLRQQNWTAGFIRLENLGAGQQPYLIGVGEKGTLLIADNPEDNRPAVRSLLRSLAGLEVPSRLRVLLVSRQPLEWWLKDAYAEEATDIVDEQSLEIDRLGDDKEIIELFRGVENKLVEQYQFAHPVVADGDIVAWARHKTNLGQLPLFLTAAAIQAVLESKGSFSFGAGEAIKRLARRERARINKLATAAGFNSSAVSSLAALSAVTGGMNERLVREFGEPPSLLQVSSVPFNAQKMADLPIWKDGRLQPTRPDVLAAALLFDVLLDYGEEASTLLWTSLSGCADDSGLEGRLRRIAYDIRSMFDADASKLVDWLSNIVASDFSRALTLEPAFKDSQSRDLNPFLLKLHEALCSFESSPPLLRAQRLRRYAMRLADAGQVSRAVTIAQQAVGIIRSASPYENDMEYRAELANCLNSVATLCLRQRDSETAINAATEAVELRRNLAMANGKYEEALASSLQTLANLSLDLKGNSKLAQEYLVEALTVHERMWRQNPTEWREREYARGLHNVSIARWRQADLQGSLSAIEACVESRRRLAAHDPGINEAGLAHSLTVWAARLNENGERLRALSLLKESFEIRNRLAKPYPLSFAAEALDSQRLISDRLADLGSRDDAIKAANDAVEIASGLLQQHPSHFEGEFSRCVVTLSNRKSECGLIAEACDDLEKHLLLARKSAEADPAKYDEVLGWYLQALAQRRSQLGNHDGAISSICEAVTIRKALAGRNKERYGPDLASALRVESLCLTSAGLWARACSAALKSVAYCRRLVQSGYPRLEIDLANSELELSFRLAEAGRRKAALDQALSAAHRFAGLVPLEKWLMPREAISLKNLAWRYRERGQLEPAETAVREANDIFEKLASEYPERFNGDLVETRSNLSSHLASLGKYEEAIHWSDKSVSLGRELYGREPRRFGPDLAFALREQARRRADMQDHEAAIQRSQEASDILKLLADETPGRFAPDFARALRDRSERKGNNRDYAAGALDAESAIGLWRHLLSSAPNRYSGELAGSLRLLASHLQLSGAKAPAIQYYEETEGLYGALSSATPEKFALDWARSLRDCWISKGRSRSDLGSTLLAAERILRTQMRREPEFFAPELAYNRWEFSLREDGPPGILALREAMSLLQNAASKAPAQYFKSWISCTQALMSRLGRSGQPLTALEIGTKVTVSVDDEIADRSWDKLSEFYDELRRCHQAAKRPPEDLDALVDSIYWLRRGASHDPKSAAERLVLKLLDYSEALRENGRSADAVLEAEQAFRLLCDHGLHENTNLQLEVRMSLALAVLSAGDYIGAFKTIDAAIKFAGQQNLAFRVDFIALRGRALANCGSLLEALSETLVEFRLVRAGMSELAAATILNHVEYAVETLRMVPPTRRHERVLDEMIAVLNDIDPNSISDLAIVGRLKSTEADLFLYRSDIANVPFAAGLWREIAMVATDILSRSTRS